MRTVGPQTHRWVPLVSQHQRNYQIIVRTITMNQWGVRSRTDVHWIDVERVGKSVTTVFSPTRLANSAICSTPDASSLSNVPSFRVSTGCSTTFKCNFFDLGFPPDVSNSSSFRSRAHFSEALLSQYSQQQKQKQDKSKSSSSASGNDAEGGDQGAKRKKHPCPHDGCPNVYRQKSGLRYHLSHVSTGRRGP